MCAFYSIVSKTLFRLFVIQALIHSNCLAERPAITRVSGDSLSWQKFTDEIQSDDQKEVVRRAIAKDVRIDAVTPILLCVVVTTGSPISKYGAYITEVLILHVSGLKAAGEKVDFVITLTRSPYEGREWNFDHIVSATHVAPPLHSVVPMPQGGNHRSKLLSYLARLFEPDVCFSSRDLMISAILFERKFVATFGQTLSDEEIRSLAGNSKQSSK